MNEKRSFYEDVYREPKGYSLEAESPEVAARLKEIEPFVVGRPRVLEIGCGRAALGEGFGSYVGLDLSLVALAGAISSLRRVNGSAEALPFRSHTFDLIISFHLLEHVDNPQSMLDEMIRVLAPTGTLYLKPAWNCRSWITQKLTTKPYSLLPMRLKLAKLLVPIRASLLWRSLFLLPKRAWSELAFRFSRSTGLPFKRLTPNYEYDAYWTSDADASVSIDSHTVMLYLRRRAFSIVSHRKWWRQVLSRAEAVVSRRRFN